MLSILTNPFSFLGELIVECKKDYIVMLGAALSFYTILSIAPLLVIVVGVAGFFLGQDTAKEEILGNIAQYVSGDVAEFIGGLMNHVLSTPEAGIKTTIIGSVVLVFTATIVMECLRSALDIIFKSQQKPKHAIISYIKGRIASFFIILFVGLLLIGTVVGNTYLEVLISYIPSKLPFTGEIAYHTKEIVSFAMLTLAFFVLFKLLPRKRLQSKYVFLGSIVTAVLFALGTGFITRYIASRSVLTIYGASGALIVFLLYVYYSSQIIFIGAEFTKVIERRGKK